MIKYYRLLDMLNRRAMTKEDLRQLIGISSATMSKISVHKPVSLDVIDKICDTLHCQPGDIIEHIPESQEITPAATFTDSKKQTGMVPELQELPEASQHPTPQKQKTPYRPFTQEESERIDLRELLKNIRYQFEIQDTFGQEVLEQLMNKAKSNAPTAASE